jgi:hypothetical protein
MTKPVAKPVRPVAPRKRSFERECFECGAVGRHLSFCVKTK